MDVENENSVNTLTLTLEATIGDTVLKIQELTKSLRRLQNVVKHDISDGLKKMSDSLKRFSQELDTIDLSKLTKLADTLEKISKYSNIKVKVKTSQKSDDSDTVTGSKSGTSRSGGSSQNGLIKSTNWNYYNGQNRSYNSQYEEGFYTNSPNDNKDWYSTAKDTFGNLKDSFQSIGDKLKQTLYPSKNASFGATITSIFLRTIIYSAVRTLLNGIVKAIKEGINDYYAYSKRTNGSFAKSLDTLSSGWEKLQATLVLMFQPAIEGFSNIVGTLFTEFSKIYNVLALYNAKLNNQSKVTIVNTEAVKALEETNAKLLNIDELNTVDKQEDFFKDITLNEDGTNGASIKISNSLTELLRLLPIIIKIAKKAYDINDDDNTGGGSDGGGSILQAELDSLKQTVANWESDYSTLKAEATEWEKRYNDANASLIELQSEYSVLESEYSDYRKHNTNNDTFPDWARWVVGAIIGLVIGILATWGLSSLFKGGGIKIGSKSGKGVHVFGASNSSAEETTALDGVEESVDTFSTFFDSLEGADSLSEVWDSVESLIDNLGYTDSINTILDALSGNLEPEEYKELGKTIGGYLVEGITESIKLTFSILPSFLIGLIQGILPELPELLVELIQGVLSTVGELLKSAPTLTGELVVNAIIATIDIAEYAVELSKSIASGVVSFFTGGEFKTQTETVISSFKLLGASAIDSFKSGFSTIGNFFKNIGVSVVNSIIEGLNKLGSITLPTINLGAIGKFGGDTITLFNLPTIPTYSTGGFVEDGLFFANHGELVGNFGNGRTAVANNEQIIQGIEAGVYNAVVSAIGQRNGSGNIELKVYLDGKQIRSNIEQSKFESGYHIANGGIIL